MGSDWDEAETTRVLESWMHWGLARHSGVLTPRSVAEAVCTAVCAPRGTHYLSMEIQPEAPITDSPIKVSTFPDDLGAS